MGETRKTGPQLADIQVGTVDAEFLDGFAVLLAKVADACQETADGAARVPAAYLTELSGACGSALAWANMARRELGS